ncbi:hypothetical protein [uncultured Enterovirga sp.]|uniref:hypothetical protein n=1 Tax=uncultured Enterovirga sp. TaxID=2026352 RepID=UPI0035CA0707
MAGLSDLLAPGSRRDIGAAIATLLANYPADNASPAVERARAQSWAEALEGLPAWAVDKARRKWMRGEVAGVNPDFAPKPPRFRQIVVDVLSPVYERRNRLAMLLKAEVEREIPEDERERVSERLAAFRVELSKTAAVASLGPAPADRPVHPHHDHHDTKAA